jgi:hypothetical protein
MWKLVLPAILLLSVGCHTAAIAPVEGSVPEKMDLKKVESAISKGASERGWIAKTLSPGTIELSLQNRSHRVVVDVKFTPSNYTITYKDSSNMNYDASSNTIHPKYGKWITNLRQSIDKNLAFTK